MDYYRFAVRLGLAALVATTAIGCAQERDPINKVQANALDKSFFVGANLSDPSDDPEFYASTTVVDVPFGISASVYTGATGSLARIKWEISEKVLNARLTYETVQNIDGKGNRTTNTGAVIASYSIDSHFDIKRDYNPQTGEELNVIVENSTDRPWYEREYMRVDWSSNKIVSAYEFDPLASLQLDGEDLESLDYRVDDPSDPDAPVFDADHGYFDITNKIYIKPHTIGGTPACYYYASVVVGGMAPYGSCDSAEVKLRHSYMRIAQPNEPGYRDYSPQEWDGARFNAHGAFTVDRLGYDRHYGIIDSQWHHLIQRYNIWQQSHTTVPCAQTAGVDAHADADLNGTEDECETAGAGSKCDDFVGLCTKPFAQRTTSHIAWHYNLNGADAGSPPDQNVIFDSTDHAAEEWDTALREAVQAARQVECTRTGGKSLIGSPFEGKGDCATVFPISQEDDAEVATVRAVNQCVKAHGGDASQCAPQNPNSVAALPKIIALCHNPVQATDDPMCGGAGLVTRPGDLRYHQVNVVPTPQSASPWGYGPSNADPLTGEVIQASINVWNSVTDQTAQLIVDQIRWINGEISQDEVVSGDYVQNWAVAAASHSPGSSPLMTSAEIDRRILGTGATTPDKLARAADLRRTINMPKINKDIMQRTATAVGLPGDVTSTAAGTARAEGFARLAQLKGTPIEAALTTPEWLQMAGVPQGTKLDDAVLDQASPLRALDGDTVAQMEQKMHAELAAKGQCMMLAPEPTGIVALAGIMAKKFPYDSKISAGQQASRVNTMWNYLRGKLNYAVIAHEMGHTVGLRHNFTSSWDKFNYRPQYWQLRTHTGSVTKACTGPTADGSTCVGPRYFDPLDQDEINNMIWMWSQTSIMDYAGDVTQDTIGIGVYDYSAARSFYGDVVDVRNDGVQVPPANADRTAMTKSQLVGSEMFDLVDTSVRTLAQTFVSDDPAGSRPLHYSQWNNFFNMVDKKRCHQVDISPPPGWDKTNNGEYSPIFDGHIVVFGNAPTTGEVCDRIPVDYVDWRDMIPDTSYATYVNYSPFWIVSRRAVDNKNRPRMPYAFGTDDAVEAGIPSTYQHDNGADMYEEVMFHDSLYEDRHIFDNFRRGRVNFSLYGAYQRAVSRYHGKIGGLLDGYSFTHDYILRFYSDLSSDQGQLVSYSDFVAAYEGDGGPFRDLAIASALGMDHFTRTLTRPQPGPHGFAPGQLKDPVLRPDDGAATAHDVDIPLGSWAPGGTDGQALTTNVSYGGRSMENGAVSSGGYWNVNAAGSYYDKTHAIFNIVAQGSGGGNWSRAEAIDSRWLSSNFANLYPEGVRQLIGSLLIDDNEIDAPRLPAKASGLPSVSWNADRSIGTPTDAIGWVSFVSGDGPAVCWPTKGSQVCTDGQGAPLATTGTTAAVLPGVPVDPEIGFEVQKWILAYSYAFLPASQRNDWLDMLRVYKLSISSPSPFAAGQSIEFSDPETGFRYIAMKFGDEKLLGKTYDKGISAKMLQWANYLESKAYQAADPTQPFDPVTGRFLYATNAQGQPIVQLDPIRPPSDPANVKCEDNRYCLQLRDYRGLIDFSHAIAGQLGFLDLELNGIYMVGGSGGN